MGRTPSPEPSALDLVAEAVRRADRAEAAERTARAQCQQAWEDRRRADLALEIEKQERAPLRAQNGHLGNLVRTLWSGLDGAQRDAFQRNINDTHRRALFNLLGITEWRDDVT